MLTEVQFATLKIPPDYGMTSALYVAFLAYTTSFALGYAAVWFFSFLRRPGPPRATSRIAREDVRLGRELSSGSFGKAYSGFWRGCKVAVKQVDVCHSPLAHEVLLGELLRHPNLVPVYGSCLDRTGSTRLIIMELCDKGALYRRVDVLWPLLRTNFPKALREILLNLLDVACAVEYMHDNNTCHGDLKCSNVLCRSNALDSRGYTCKICDLGMAVRRDGSMEAEGGQLGTVLFTSPEQLKGQRTEKTCNVYAFGMLAWHLMCGEAEEAVNLPDCVQQHRVVEKDWRPAISKIVPDRYRELIQSCWQISAERPPLILELREALLDYLETERKRKEEGMG